MEAQDAFDVWLQVGPRGGPLAALAVDPEDPARWLAADGPLILERPEEGRWRPLGSLPAGNVVHLVADTTRPDRFFAASQGTSVVSTSWTWRSEDGGTTWQDLAIPPGPSLAVRAIAPVDSGVWFATSAGLTLTVEDLESGALRHYTNPLGSFASVGDTAAF